MIITSQLVETFLKCPTKCYLRSLNETATGNAYAEWVRVQNESYQIEAARRLQKGVPENECVNAPPPAENLKAAKWRLAFELKIRVNKSADGSVPKQEIGNGTRGQSCPRLEGQVNRQVDSMESFLHAVGRAPSERRGRPVRFVPIRFVFWNKLTKDDRLLLAFDALVFSEALGREVRVGKIIHGDDHTTLNVKLPSLLKEVRKLIGSGRAFNPPLPHHPACGSAPGGS